jgi:transcriptional regulator with XRE-family HTH domain
MYDVLKRITELREEKGWSVYRVAKEAGIPNSSIRTWYSKDLTPPLDAIEKISNAFDLTLSEFFDDNRKAIETNLARIRKQKGLTQQDLARESGVSAEIISAFEQNRTRIRKASYDTIERIATVLACEMKDLVENEEG